MSFRPDEREEIMAAVGRARPGLLEGEWEERLSQAERSIALTAWRSLPILIRIRALLDWLSIMDPVTFPVTVTGPRRRGPARRP